MLGDKQSQKQEQKVDQRVEINHGQGPSKIHCPHYTDPSVEVIERELNQAIAESTRLPGGNALAVANLHKTLREARRVSFLAHQGNVSAIMCGLVDASGYKCLSPKHKGQRCLLRGPAPASSGFGTAAPKPYHPFDDLD